jgi:transcriptional regulator with XRE-family HTH domain
MNRGTIVSFQRQRANMSIPELAEKIDMTVSTLEDIESNLRSPKVYELEAMAVAMAIPYWYLGDPNPIESRVIISTHGDNVYNANGSLQDGPEQIKAHLVDLLEMDSYFADCKERGLLDNYVTGWKEKGILDV